MVVDEWILIFALHTNEIYDIYNVYMAIAMINDIAFDSMDHIFCSWSKCFIRLMRVK